MFNKFYPNEYVDSVYDINYDKLWQNGIRGLLFDIDNTLAEHGMAPEEKMVHFINELKNKGFKICVLSNNSEERIKLFNKDINVLYIAKSGKPSIKAYKRGMEKTKTSLKKTVFIGDQIFTDIFGANMAGMYSILVKPIAKHEEIQIVIKRKFEKIILHSYKRNLKRK